MDVWDVLYAISRRRNSKSCMFKNVTFRVQRDHIWTIEPTSVIFSCILCLWMLFRVCESTGRFGWWLVRQAKYQSYTTTLHPRKTQKIISRHSKHYVAASLIFYRDSLQSSTLWTRKYGIRTDWNRWASLPNKVNPSKSFFFKLYQRGVRCFLQQRTTAFDIWAIEFAKQKLSTARRLYRILSDQKRGQVDVMMFLNFDFIKMVNCYRRLNIQKSNLRCKERYDLPI